ncbi:caldesmon-like [Ixodes scapularis]
MAASSVPGTSGSASQRKRFTVAEDLLLLQEIAARNPYGEPQRWADILSRLIAATGREFTMRAVRERADLLLGYFRQQDTANLRKSGTEEQYTEKEQLLQEISDLAREFGHRPKTVPRKGASGAASLKRRLHTSVAAEVRAAKAARAGATSSMPATPPGDHEDSAAYTLLMQSYQDDLDEEGEGEDEGLASQAQATPTDPSNTNIGALGQETLSAPPAPTRASAVRRKRRQQSDEMDFLERRAQQESEREDRRFALEERAMALQERRLALEEKKYQDDSQARRAAREAVEEERKILTEERTVLAEERAILQEERRVDIEERRAAAEERRALAAQQELQMQLLIKYAQK